MSEIKKDNNIETTEKKKDRSSLAVALILIIGIVVFLGIMIFTGNSGLKTALEKKNNQLVAEEEKRESYQIRFTNDQDFYSTKRIVHDGIIYVAVPGLGIQDESVIGEELGTTTGSLKFSLNEVTAEEGSAYLFSGANKYYEFKGNNKFIIAEGHHTTRLLLESNNQDPIVIKNTFEGEEKFLDGYIVLVNEDFFDYYNYYNDIERLKEKRDTITMVTVSQYINKSKGKTGEADIPLDDYFLLMNNFKSEEEFQMGSTSTLDVVGNYLRVYFQDKTVLSFLVSCRKADCSIFVYKDIWGENSLEALVYPFKDTEDNRRILKYFYPDYEK